MTSGTALLCEPARLDWSQAGGPRAVDFGDVYFSVEDGLEEARAVFLQACDLPRAWRDRPVFTVGELGFGTGLNALALWQLWREAGNREGWLHFVSVEKHPLTLQDARRAFAAWPQLSELSRQLLAQWPGLLKGPHRLIFPRDRFSITVFHDEAEAALSQMQAGIDAWFLDGFAPACNGAMWSPDIFSHLARLSNPGARVGTFTVAGAVRRGLAEAGFDVAKLAGFGRKRERLEAVFPGDGPGATVKTGNICILGAGIAGASLAHAFAMRGRSVRIIDPKGVAGGASAAPAGLLTPRLEKADRPHVRATLAAFGFARRLYAERAAFHGSGVTRLLRNAAEQERFGAIAQLMGEGYEVEDDALAMSGAGWFDPAALVRDLISNVPVEPAGQVEAGEILIHATGPRAPLGEDITPSAGRVGVFDLPPPERPLSWGGYLSPTPDGQVLLGATHLKAWEAPEDNAAIAALADQLRALRPELAPPPEQQLLGSWSGVRASTPDRLPVAGRLDDQAYILSGLGSRGFAHAPLLAEQIASEICGEPLPLERDGRAVLAPQRFAERRARRRPEQA